MASWYVEQLITNSVEIKGNIESIVPDYYEDFEEEMPYTLFVDLNNDYYSDLISVELAISVLSKSSLISKKEIRIIDLFKKGYNITDITRLLNISKDTVYTLFKNACNKIAFYLGEYFTDDGYIEYMTYKYNLSDEYIDKLSKLIKRNKN